MMKSVHRQKSSTMSVEVKSAIDENSFDEKNNILENSTLVNPCSEFIKPRHYKQLREKLEIIVETSNKFESLRIKNENEEVFFITVS